VAEGGRRVAVIADAEWLNQEAQNALLRLLEEPPPDTLVVLVARSSAGLLATVRSPASRPLPRERGRRPAAPGWRGSRGSDASLPALLDWAEGIAAPARGVEEVERLLEPARPGAGRELREAGADRVRSSGAFRATACRKSLVQRNANPDGGRARCCPAHTPAHEQGVFCHTPIYYVNAEPHIGHTYTTVAVDTLARYHRLCGEPTFFLTGTDEHGEKIAEAAEQRGATPKEVADQYSAAFQATWQQLGFSFDRFIRTTDPDHVRNVRAVLQRLWDQGEIDFREYEASVSDASASSPSAP
jgi:hypothetical protein